MFLTGLPQSTVRAFSVESEPYDAIKVLSCMPDASSQTNSTDPGEWTPCKLSKLSNLETFALMKDSFGAFFKTIFSAVY